MSKRSITWRRAAALLSVAVMFTAACGGDDDSGGDAAADTSSPGGTTAVETPADPQAEAASLVEEISGPLTWEAPEPAYTPDLAAVDGQTVYFIANSLPVPYWQNILGGMEEAADMLGIELTAVDGQGDPSEVARLIDQAVTQDATAIMLGSIPVDLVAEPISAAVEAGVHVIASDSIGLTPADEEVGVFANASTCFECAGRQMADIAIANQGEGINAVVVRVPEIGPSEALAAEGFADELTTLCPDCTVTESEAPIAQWGTALPSISSSVASDPNINLVVPMVDAMISLMSPALSAAPRDISVISYNATAPAMEMLANEDLVTGLVGSPGAWQGYYMIDQVVRAVSDGEPLSGPISGNRAFTAANIGEIDITAPDATDRKSVV